MCSAVRLLFAMVLLGAVVIYCIGGGGRSCDGSFFFSDEICLAGVTRIISTSI